MSDSILEDERPIQHETLWFSDGNIVLKTDKRLYRVHKGVLAHQSAFFQGMFAMPTPAMVEDPEGYHDGIEAVRMVGDADKDVEILLQMVYTTSYITSMVRLPTYDVVVPLLRLSTKYELNAFLDDIIRSLRPIYPDTLHALNIPSRNRDEMRFLSYPEANCNERRLYLLKLLREVGDGKADILMPSLVYLSFCDMLVKKEPGWGPFIPAICFSLATEDLIDYLRNVQQARNFATQRLHCHTLFYNLRRNRGRDCSSLCAKGLVLTCSDGHGIHTDFLQLLEIDADTRFGEWDKASICEVCLDDVKAFYEGGRQDIWDNLPKLFGLPDWNTMRERWEVSA